LYIDGLAVSTAAAPSASYNVSTASQPYPLALGAVIYSQRNVFLKGSLDDAKVFNYALSDAQIAGLVGVPTIPSNLTLVASSPTAVTVSWEESTDPSGILHYVIYRNGTEVGTSTTNTYVDTGLTPNTIYFYSVSAQSAIGTKSSQVHEKNVVTQKSGVHSFQVFEELSLSGKPNLTRGG
jgi:hypothetical protein